MLVALSEMEIDSKRHQRRSQRELDGYRLL
jgi:hypothetical protein